MIAAVSELGGAEGVFLQYGAIGAILICFLVYSYSAVKREREATDRERARAEKAEDALAELNRLMRTEVIPVLTKTTDATARATEVFGRVSEVLAEVSAALRAAR